MSLVMCTRVISFGRLEEVHDGLRTHILDFDKRL